VQNDAFVPALTKNASCGLADGYSAPLLDTAIRSEIALQSHLLPLGTGYATTLVGAQALSHRL